MSTFSIIALVILILTGVYWVLARRGSAGKKVVINRPKMCIVDFSNGECNSDIASDKAALGEFFESSSVSTEVPPVCDVLLIYGQIEADGSVKNSILGLREIIRESKAAIAIVASNNLPNNYTQAAKKKKYGQANLVLTLDRKGNEFSQFFRKLFGAMKQGVSMPAAWVQLAPQNPGADHKGGPELICALEVGQIAFA